MRATGNGGKRHHFSCPLRWGDMDAQAHLNNAAFLDYLQEARVHYLLTGPPVMGELLATGVVVVQHQVEYLRPVVFADAGARPALDIELWVNGAGGSRFVIGYEVRSGTTLAVRARTTGAPYDLRRQALRRLTDAERAYFTDLLNPAEALPAQPRPRWSSGGHRFPLSVRWSDLDSYGHVNNVRYFDYLQEARIALVAEAVGWRSDERGEVWVIVRQDLDYLRPLDFRLEPYEVNTVVAEVGNRSITLAAEIRDPASEVVFGAGRTVLVGPTPFTAEQRSALSRFAPDGG